MAMATKDIKDARRNFFINLDTLIVYKIISDDPIGRDSVNIPVYKVTHASIQEKMSLSTEFLSMKKLNNHDSNSTLLYQEIFSKNHGLPFHKNLMPVHAHFVDSETQDLCVVFPYAERGSLRSIMADTFHYGFEEACISIALRCVLKGLCFLHRSKILHRDINAGHVYVKNGPHIMLGFGANIYEHGNFNAECSSHSELPATQISIWGAPPEVYNTVDENQYYEKSDIWLFGITALELSYGGIKVPNRETLEMMIREIVETKKLPKKPIMEETEEFERSFSMEFGKMVAECLTWNPDDRPTAFTLLKHEFFGKNGLKRRVFKKNFQDVVIQEMDETLFSNLPANKKKPNSGITIPGADGIDLKKPKSDITLPGAESFDGVMDINFKHFYPTCPTVDPNLPNSFYEPIDAVPLTWSFKKPKRPKRKLLDENSEEAGREMKAERKEENNERNNVEEAEDVKYEGDGEDDDNSEYSSPSTPSTPPTPPYINDHLDMAFGPPSPPAESPTPSYINDHLDMAFGPPSPPAESPTPSYINDHLDMAFGPPSPPAE